MRLEQQAALTDTNSTNEVKQLESQQEESKDVVIEDIDLNEIVPKPINHEFKISKRSRKKKVINQLTEQISEFT